MTSRIQGFAVMLALCAWCLPAHAVEADYQAQLGCQTPQTRRLLTTPLQPDPRTNVWVLEVLDAMGANRTCNALDPYQLARYLERTAVNGIVQYL